MTAYTETDMKKQIKSRLIRDMIRNILLLGLGLMMIIFPDFTKRGFAVVLGWVLVAVGGLSILGSLIKWKVLGIVQLLLGIALAGFGVYILVVPGALGWIFGIAVGIYMTLNGLIQALQCFRPKEKGGNVVLGILGLVMAVMGVVLMVVPATTVEIVMLIAGIALLLTSGIALAMRIVLLCKLKKLPSMVIDAEQ